MEKKKCRLSVLPVEDLESSEHSNQTYRHNKAIRIKTDSVVHFTAYSSNKINRKIYQICHKVITATKKRNRNFKPIASIRLQAENTERIKAAQIKDYKN